VSPRARWEPKSRAKRPEPPKPIPIHFTEAERHWIRWDGERRQARDEARGGRHYFGQNNSESDRARNIDAAGGEAGITKLLNVYWYPTPRQPGVAVVAGVIEVRWTLHHANARLPVRAMDDKTRIYVLTSGNDSRGGLFARGWLYGWEAKRQEWATDPKDPRPAAWGWYRGHIFAISRRCPTFTDSVW
jgi:hypothetical protein